MLNASTLDFKKYLYSNKIKYPNITKSIYDFYMDKSLMEINDVINRKDSDALRKERMLFYKDLGLTTSYDEQITGDRLRKWEGNYYEDPANGTGTQRINDYINKSNSSNITIKITMSTPYKIKTKKELNEENIYEKELLALIDETKQHITSDQLFSLRLYDMPSLVYFDEDKTVFSLDSGKDKKVSESSFKLYQVFDNMWKAKEGQITNVKYEVKDLNFERSFMDYFKNEALYVLKELENNILKKAADYKLIELEKVKQNPAWNKYNNLLGIYSLISKVNIIEHWNQLWTSSLNYSPFWFEPLQNSNIDFQKQNNYLMSYEDYHLKLTADNKIDRDVKALLNTKIIFIIYLIIGCLFLLGAWLILRRKVIL